MAPPANIKATDKHPTGLYVLFGVEAWERFCYYGMRAILMLYMVNFLFFDPAMETDEIVLAGVTSKASTIYGWFTGLVYLTPVFGGYIADRYLGQRKSIVIGAIMMGAGYFLMAVPQISFFYIALGVVIVGNGFFKPNISTLVGQLYADNDPRRDGAFTIFYMGINLGAIFSPLICGTLGEMVGWHWGFMAAGIGMIASLVIYFLWQKHLGSIGLKPAYQQKENVSNEPLTLEEKQRMAVILILAFFVVFFWISFEQAGSSLTLFAERSTNRVIFGFEVPASWFQSINPIFIVILAPIFSSMWTGLSKRGLDPSTPRKMAIGLILASLGFLILIPASMLATDGNQVNMLWLCSVYFTLTVGELCVSPIGLSMVTKLAPVKLLSLLMGVWFTANFFSNLGAGLFAGLYDKMDMTTFFLIPVATAGGAGLFLLLISKPLQRWMHDKN